MRPPPPEGFHGEGAAVKAAAPGRGMVPYLARTLDVTRHKGDIWRA
jgi:hypothetical protein